MRIYGNRECAIIKIEPPDGLVVIHLGGRRYIFNPGGTDGQCDDKRGDAGIGADSPRDGVEDGSGGIRIPGGDGDRDGRRYTGRRDDEDASASSAGGAAGGDNNEPGVGPQEKLSEGGEDDARGDGSESPDNPGELGHDNTAIKMVIYHLSKALGHVDKLGTEAARQYFSEIGKMVILAKEFLR